MMNFQKCSTNVASIIPPKPYWFSLNSHKVISVMQPNNLISTYTYDATNQIKTEHRAGTSSTAPFRTTFTYDATGNRIKQEVDNNIRLPPAFPFHILCDVQCTAPHEPQKENNKLNITCYSKGKLGGSLTYEAKSCIFMMFPVP